MTPFWTVSLFWIAAVVCVAVALVFVLPPLLRRRAAEAKAGRRDINIAVYRDQLKEMEADRITGLLSEEQFQTAKVELEARLAEDALAQDADEAAPTHVGGRKSGYTLAAVIPAAAFGLYFVMGNPGAIAAIAEGQDNPQAVQGEHDIMKMIQKVEEKTRTDPNDAVAWSMLAKTYAAVGHWPEALNAFEKAIKLRPEDPAVMTGYAEALAISGNRVLDGKPMELVLKALEINPDEPKGLELAGIGNFQKRNFAQAAYYFKRLMKTLPPDSPYTQDISEAYKEAKRLSEGAMTGLDNLADQGSDKPAAAGPTITGKVDLAPALKAQVKDTDAVFLFARSGEAGPPVAAIRAPAGAFPLEFELNDTQAMNPSNSLSKHKEVTVVARIPKSGQITGAAGDLESKPMVMKVGAKDMKIVIDTVRK